jgi:hypothetical protein
MAANMVEGGRQDLPAGDPPAGSHGKVAGGSPVYNTTGCDRRGCGVRPGGCNRCHDGLRQRSAAVLPLAGHMLPLDSGAMHHSQPNLRHSAAWPAAQSVLCSGRQL